MLPAGFSERETMNQFPLSASDSDFLDPKPQFRIRFIASRSLGQTVRISAKTSICRRASPTSAIPNHTIPESHRENPPLFWTQALFPFSPSWISGVSRRHQIARLWSMWFIDFGPHNGLNKHIPQYVRCRFVLNYFSGQENVVPGAGYANQPGGICLIANLKASRFPWVWPKIRKAVRNK
jgi:hypothetical protein